MAAPSDVVVVGAGIVGCAVAYELARRGASVDIVDDRPAGMGATHASAGVLAPFIEAGDGHPLLELTVRSLDLFDTFVARVSGDNGAPVRYHRTGTLDVAADEAALRRLEAAAEGLSRRGVASTLLDAAAARKAEPHLSTGVTGGLLIAAHGYVAAANLTRALSAAARRHNVKNVDQGRVRHIRRSGDELEVRTERGSLIANAVVIAAGSWSGQIQIEGVPDRLPVHPVRGQLLELGWNGPPLARVTWAERCYLVPWDDGTLLVGATVEDAGFDERTTTAGVRDLIEAACEVVPHAWTASFKGARAGLRPATPDDLPIIGRSVEVPNVVYATGHYRNGILLAPLTAQIVADLLLEQRSDPALAVTSPQRFGRL